MRRALAALALIAALAPAATAADRGVLVIVPGQAFSGSNVSTIKDNESVQQITLFFQRAGITYTVVRGSAAKTHWARRGTYQLANGDSITHAAVVHVGFQVGRMATAPAGYRPDSLTLVAAAPTVPQIFLGASFPVFTQTTGCSTGVTADFWSTGPATTAADSTYFVNALSDESNTLTGLAWRLEDKVGSTSDPGAQGAGNFRSITEARLGAAITTCVNCDSTASGINFGGYLTWMRQMNHVNGAKPCYFVCAFPGLADLFIREGGIVNFALAMASADSFAGGAIYGSKPKKLTAAIVIEGLYKRRATDASNRGGQLGLEGLPADIVAFDSTAVMAQFDSIYTNFPNLPITFAVELDSLYHYQRDEYYGPRRLSRWRVMPGGYAGQASQTFGSNSSFQTPNTRGTWHRPLDYLGRSRTRFAIGDGDYTVSTSDSSIAALVSGAFNVLRIKFGRERVSQSIFALPNDYANNAAFSAVGKDSFFSALHNGGCRAFISPIRAFTTYQASLAEIAQRDYRVPYGPTAGGNLKLLLSSNGVSTIGQERGILVATQYAQLAYDGIFLGINSANYQNSVVAAGKPGVRAGSSSVITLDVAHFGTGSNGRWNMFGWRYIKYCVNPIIAYNRLAGRTLAEFVWPEDVEP